MKKSILIIILAGLAVFTLNADDSSEAVDAADIFAMAPGLEGAALSDVLIDDLLLLAESMSVRVQEEKYIERVARSSFFIPGTGQLMSGQTGLGIAQLSAHLAVTGGSLVAAWFLLPEQLQTGFDNYAEKKAYFETVNYRELLPSAAVLFSGNILNHLLGVWSSRGAEAAARRAVAEGGVRFSPDLRYVGGLPFFGLSMHH